MIWEPDVAASSVAPSPAAACGDSSLLLVCCVMSTFSVWHTENISWNILKSIRIHFLETLNLYLQVKLYSASISNGLHVIWGLSSNSLEAFHCIAFLLLAFPKTALKTIFFGADLYSHSWIQACCSLVRLANLNMHVPNRRKLGGCLNNQWAGNYLLPSHDTSLSFWNWVICCFLFSLPVLCAQLLTT